MSLEDDPMFAALREEKPPPKEMIPLENEESEFYAQLFFKHLSLYQNNNVEAELINRKNLELMLEDTQFKCHEDPEEVENLMLHIDPEDHGFFNLA